MARYYRANDSLWIKAVEENGVYKLLFTARKQTLVATKNSRKAHAEAYYSYYDKTFATKERANSYFKKVKASNPDLRLVTLAEYQREPV